jgi:hypothetical protein
VQSDANHMSEHYLTSKTPCVSYWDPEMLDGQDINNMLSHADTSYVAFSATSGSGTPVEIIRSSLTKFNQMQNRVA